MPKMKFIPCKDATSKRHFWKYVDRIIEYVKPGPKIEHMSTMDLDGNNKLYPDYLGRRKARRKARKAEKEFIAGHVGNDVY